MPHANHSKPPNTRPDSREACAISRLSSETQWRLKKEVVFQFDTYHPQGMTRCGDCFFLSSVEIIESAGSENVLGVGRGHLFRTDFNGVLTGHIELGEGAIYHPGGIDFDGTWLWVPVAEYRPNSRSIIYRVEPNTMKTYEVFRTQDHIGALVRRPAGQGLHGFSWASQRHYAWKLDEDLRVSGPNTVPIEVIRPAESPVIAYQDCQYLSDGLAACGGHLDGYGAIDIVDLEENKVINHVPVEFARSRKGAPLTRNPLYLECECDGDGVDIYFAPDDNETTLYIYEVKLDGTVT